MVPLLSCRGEPGDRGHRQSLRPLLIFRSLVLFTVSVESRFWASHCLTLPDGSTEPRHCHNWTVTADVDAEKLNRMGLVMDFGQLKTMIDEITADLENTSLEELAYFEKNNPSAENVARYIYERLESRLTKDLLLNCVRVVEEPGCSVKFGR